MLCLTAHCIIHIKFPPDKKIHRIKNMYEQKSSAYLYLHTHIDYSGSYRNKNCNRHNLIIDDGKSIEIM